MNYQSTYQAAGKIAITVENHFMQHLAAAKADGGQDLAAVPSAVVIEQLIDAAFWASLRKEEGHSPKISIAFLSPEQGGNPLVFENQLPFSVRVLTKLAPGVERAGIHIGVWFNGDELYIWGTTLKIPNFCFVLDVPEPGLLVIKHRRLYGLGKYTNVAILKGDEVKVVDEYSASLPDCPPILQSLLTYTSPSSWNNTVNVLIQLAVSMRAHAHGGILLVVPADTDAWRESIIQPMQYTLKPPFSGLADLIHQEGTDTSEVSWKSALSREVGNIAGLTAIDGATVISNKHELLAFGVKIGMLKGSVRVGEMSFTEPIIGGEAVVVHPAKNGGTRHLSAAQFIHDQRNATALVASQDGHFTIFSWSDQKNIVQAHRIDTLLL
ncbi:MAG: putative sensor domain DACNV-containing protein [Sphingobacteriaceae bacterium]